jgi:phosphomannomutase/phosphoglucomutase
MNPLIFREYDIRGIVADDLTENVVRDIGSALGTYLVRLDAKKVCIGHDVRLTSPRLAGWIKDSLVGCGLHVIDAGEVPTPALYYTIVHEKADGGVQITGSHNPIEYNGFKMCHGLMAIYGETIQELKGLIDARDFETGEGSIEKIDIINAYVDDILSRIELKKPLKLVLDSGNGCASEIAPKVLERLGCEVIPLYCEIDGNFPNHLPDPTVAKYVKDLIAKVKKTGADAGFGYDGDADRIGAIDNEGSIIAGDKLVAIFARELLGRRLGEPIIFDVKCSQALSEDISAHGGEPVMWKTGHSLIKTKMKETNAPLAGEMSGHIFFQDGFHGYDDAIYNSARLAQIISEADTTFAEMAATIPQYVSTPELRVEATDEEKFNIVAELVETFKNQGHEVIDIDGLRVMFGDGWGLLRASNTQPVLVMRFEARSTERLNEIAETVLSEVGKYPSVRLNDLDLGI